MRPIGAIDLEPMANLLAALTARQYALVAAIIALVLTGAVTVVWTITRATKNDSNPDDE